MYNGFTIGKQYVVEEKLAGGRLLCHDLGNEGNKRIVPLGSRVCNKLYSRGACGEITFYDGYRLQVYDNSILTCKSDSEGFYFEGIFYNNYDIPMFREGGIYFYRGLDNEGNILVSDSKRGVTSKIPKGVVLSPELYGSWVYNGYNAIMPEVNAEIYCTSIKSDIVFIGEFGQVDSLSGALGSEEGYKCPECGEVINEEDFVLADMKVARFSNGVKAYESINRLKKYTCKVCGSLLLEYESGFDSSVCIVDVKEE